MPEPLPSLVAFDLDGTLAPSKSTVTEPMAAALRALLDVVPVCIISGGQIRQFRDQVLDVLGAGPAQLSRLHLMPTCGTRYYVYDGACGNDRDASAVSGGSRAGGDVGGSAPESWRLVYANDLTPAQVREGRAAVEAEARRLGLWEERTWGPVVEDRGSQVTFSALGQEAPLEAKKAWDPTGERRRLLRDAVAARLPGLEVRSGGSTSVDITLKGVDKAYGVTRLAQVTGIPLEQMLFVGDSLDPGGNDYPVKALGVACCAVTSWEETNRIVTSLTERFRELDGEAAESHAWGARPRNDGGAGSQGACS